MVVSFSLFLGSQANLTGAFAGVAGSQSTSIFAIISALASGIIFASSLQSHTRLTSAIKKDRTLARLADESTNSDRVQRGLDHLTHELSQGHVPNRIRHLEGTDVFYAGSDNARIYYRLAPYGYEIVGKSGKGENQDRVINRLKKLYPKK